MSTSHRASDDTTTSTSGAAPLVVVDNGEYWLLNKGDLAMLRVTVRRLRQRWPDARIGVITRDAAMLAVHEPGVEALLFPTGADWPARPDAWDWVRHLPPGVVGGLTRTARTGRDGLRGLRRRVAGDGGASAPPARRGGGASAAPEPRRVPRALESASLVMGLGGGYLADVDPNQVHRTFDLLERAAGRGIPTALMGQGLGPLTDPALVERARAVLPLVDLIALREDVTGPQLLDSFGVSPERVVVTGDDAVELAYEVRRPSLGDGIGVCLRDAGYGPLADSVRADLASGVQSLARARGVPLVPLAVSVFENEDRRATLAVTDGYARVRRMLAKDTGAVALAGRVSECRILLTSVYHVAVFAAAQGIPVVALSTSSYYVGKFAGLNGMFGGGVTVLDTAAPDLRSQVSAALERAWDAAPDLRAAGLEAARRQIAAGTAAYERLFSLVAEA